MAIQTNFPAVKPSLLLDFANTKKLDPRITFTRTTTATYYDGVTTAKAEENLFLYSQEFDNAYWDKISASVSANAVVAPDGTSTAETITFTGAGSNARIVAVNSVISGATYTYSVFLKGTAGETVSIEFDTTPGTTVTLTSTWARYSVTNAATAGTVNSRIISRTGNTATVFDAWGAQLEQRSSVTAYTATTTQAITNYIPVLLTAASGVARFDHNPITDESLGLLIEEARTNLLTYSEQFDNAVWGKAAGSVSQTNIGIAPDGKTTADEVTTTGGGVFRASIAVANAAAYTATVFVKTISGGGSFVFGFDANPSSGRTSFYLANGTINFNEANVTSSSITDVGNGWYRCSVTATTTSTSCNLVYYNSTSGAKYFLWGAQLEAGAFATSYIPTVAAQVTRNADVASITGNNFTSWYNQGEGALYAEYIGVNNITASTTRRIAEIGDNSINNRFVAGYNATNNTRYLVVAGNSTQADVQVFGITAGSAAKFIGTYKANDFQQASNNTLGTADTAGTVPVVSQITIGSDYAQSTNTALNGTIKKLAYYPLRITNANLQALTS